MKKFSLLATFALLFSSTLIAQIYNPVSWDYKIVKTGGKTYDIIFMAEIENGWYIYSQYLEGEDGPVPTSFNFDEGAHFTKKGKNEECDLNRKAAFDKLFDMDVVKYSKHAIFRQPIKVSDDTKKITGYLEFMTCDEEKCLAPKEVDFELDLSDHYDEKAIAYSATTLCDNKVSFAATTPSEQPTEKENVRKLKKSKSKTAENTSKISSVSIADASDREKTKDKPISISAQLPVENSEGNIDENKIEEPVTWKASMTRKENGQAVLTFSAEIEDDWHIYSNTLATEDGPIKTDIVLDESDAYGASGGIVETAGEIISGHDKFFDMEVVKLKYNAELSQTLNINNETIPVKGYLDYMACTHNRCLTPVMLDFEADAKASTIKLGDELLSGGSSSAETSELEKMFGLSYTSLQEPVGACVEKVEEATSLWRIFVLGFIGGLIALLTPCVFPMIPLTVSFFTKSSDKKGKGLFNAVFYGISILLVYVLISVPFHLLDSVNPNILNDISTSVPLNIAFFLIFLFFAFSFFGYFDLTLPSSVTNKISAAEGIGGVIGIFFMALTLALVSFSCTGPILGSLLAGSLTGDGGAWQLTSGFTGFGLALGLPFGLFAAFPSMMKSLPKSGGWLNTVKVVLGFIELALAFKFLSNADLVKKWGLLKIEPFLIIWILIALGLALYLFGKIKFPHDSPIKKLSFFRISTGVLAISFAIYLMTGFRFNPETGTFHSLKFLSGLAPPVGYSWLHKVDCPQGLECFKDLNEGLTHARKVNKPVMLDFTGHACVNCRKMEEHVWPEPEVYKYLRDDFVLISLYVDEKIELPEEEQVVLPMKSGGSKKMRTTGNRWAYLQTEYFNINAQPYYVLMTADGQLLNNPVPYTPDKKEYAQFLDCGLRNYKQLGLN